MAVHSKEDISTIPGFSLCLPAIAAAGGTDGGRANAPLPFTPPTLPLDGFRAQFALCGL